MTELEQRITAFKQQRTDYLNHEKELHALEAEKQQTENTLSAFRNELDALIANAQTKLANPESLSADDYVALKNADSGLKARIEYYQALSEEIDDRLYAKKEQLFKEREALLMIRNDIFFAMAQERLNAFIADNKGHFNDIYSLLLLSGKIERNTLTEGYESTFDYAVKQHLIAQIGRGIDTDAKTPNGYELPIFTGAFQPKRPTQLHMESHQENRTGFQKLIHNLTSK